MVFVQISSLQAKNEVRGREKNLTQLRDLRYIFPIVKMGEKEM